MTKAYYGPSGSTNNEYRLSPAPQITISTEPYYSGDVLIGYTHNVSLRGYASAYRKTTDIDPSHSVSGIGLVADSIAIVKKILSRNGSELVFNEGDGVQTIKCKGGTLRSLSFNESPNNWMGYSEYSATIEFNEIELINGSSLKTIACSDSLLNPKSNSIVDISKYKIKAFTDNWSIGIDDNIYNRVINNDIGQTTDVENSSMTVTYTISATGKNYYIDNKLIPAWEQAKNFVQDRLFNKVNNMLSSTLGLSADTACAATKDLASLGSGSNTSGMFNNLNNTYGVYNETISCSTSEAEGTFSVTYNAIIKKNNNTDMNHPASKHTFNKTINKQNENNKITTINIQGTIEGMVEGGIIRANASGFSLPQNGSILANSSAKSKYSQALVALNKLFDENDFKPTIKNKLGITNSALGISSGSCGPLTNGPPPASFNLTHNYHEGTINYSIEYSSNNACGQTKDYAITSISVENPVPILAEFPLPRTGVLILQDIGTKTAKKITINIEGKNNRVCCLSPDSLSSLISGASFIIPEGLILPDPNLFLLTQKQRTDNIMDGSYSMSLGYTCSPGCNI